MLFSSSNTSLRSVEAPSMPGTESEYLLFGCTHKYAFSSDSFSLLPASPPIFHGRESELESLVDTLVAQPASVAILGPGGIGKTTLAMAILHHHSVKEKYPSRHFISCESASTRDDLLASIGSYLGLELSGQLSRAIFSHLRCVRART
jgi:DNA-binding NtrC family response regulator